MTTDTAPITIHHASSAAKSPRPPSLAVFGTILGALGLGIFAGAGLALVRGRDRDDRRSASPAVLDGTPRRRLYSGGDVARALTVEDLRAMAHRRLPRFALE